MKKSEKSINLSLQKSEKDLTIMKFVLLGWFQNEFSLRTEKGRICEDTVNVSLLVTIYELRTVHFSDIPPEQIAKVRECRQ